MYFCDVCVALIFVLFGINRSVRKMEAAEVARLQKRQAEREKWLHEEQMAKKAWWNTGCWYFTDEGGPTDVCLHCGAHPEHHDERYQKYLSRKMVIDEIKKRFPDRPEQEIWEELGRPDSWSPETEEKLSSLKAL